MNNPEQIVWNTQANFQPQILSETVFPPWFCLILELAIWKGSINYRSRFKQKSKKRGEPQTLVWRWPPTHFNKVASNSPTSKEFKASWLSIASICFKDPSKMNSWGMLDSERPYDSHKLPLLLACHFPHTPKENEKARSNPCRQEYIWSKPHHSGSECWMLNYFLKLSSQGGEGKVSFKNQEKKWELGRDGRWRRYLQVLII